MEQDTELNMEQYMEQWANTPGTLEAAVKALSPAEIAAGLDILRKIKRTVYDHAAAAGLKPYNWDGQTADDLLQAFEFAGGGSGA